VRGTHKSLTLVAVFILTAVACGREGALIAQSEKGKTNVSVGLPGRASAAALEAFADCGAVTKTLRTQALRYVGPYGLGGYGNVVGDMVGGAVRMQANTGAAESAPTAGPALKAGQDFSDTNVQEQGVDEPDIVETDGRRLFAVTHDNVLQAVTIGDGTPRLAGKLTLKSASSQLMLAGDRLIVVGNAQPSVQPQPANPGGAQLLIAPVGSDKTLVEIIDVSNPTSMRVVSSLEIDGGYISARAVDGIARVVIRRGQPAIPFAYPQDGSQSNVDRALKANKDAIEHATIDKWIPRYELKTGDKSSSGAISSCDSTYRPTPFAGFGTVSVVTIDPASPTPREGSTVVGGGDIVYASQKALYVTTIRQPEPQPLGAPAGPSGVAEAPAVAPDAPVEAPVAVPQQKVETQVHKFDISGTTAKYLASGIVNGTLLNQFSMSEFEDNLRVATTIDSFTETAKNESAVSVFAQRGAQLVQIGRVAGLGRGEQIHAVRFIGPVGYVVTFRQVDPLYTIDLSNPAAPKVAGELKIPGFSSYLHPIADGLVLGIGTEANARGEVHDAQGRYFGAKVSLFDVSDPARPRELHKLTIAGTQSAVEFDHHAFLWWGPRKLAVLPVAEYGEPPNNFVGAVTMEIDRSAGIESKRRIVHPGKSEQTNSAPVIVRSVIAGDALYTLSNEGLLTSDLGSAKDTWLPFA
jgi:uncharacterized secreted protein with C-terminal beta-propeller domain